MGLSVAISGGIILTVFVLILFSLPGLADKMFSIGDITTQVTQHEQKISNTEISMDHLSVLVGSSKVNFTLNNDGSEKLWNFEDYNLFIEYDGTISGKLIEELSFSGECLDTAPLTGNWCIQSITNDVKDPGIINAGEEATIWTNVNENLATNQGIISVTTDNGVVATVSTTTCGSFCYQMIWEVQSDQSANTWTNMPAAVTEFDSIALFRTRIDLTDMTEWRIFHRSTSGAGTAACVIGAQYSTNGGATWNGLDNGVGGSISTSQTSCNLAGDFISAWTPLDIPAQADVFLRVVGAGGDGVADPPFGRIQLQFRS
jgi:archaellum component FlaF (FlaF/FlaG flagellin family)